MYSAFKLQIATDFFNTLIAAFQYNCFPLGISILLSLYPLPTPHSRFTLSFPPTHSQHRAGWRSAMERDPEEVRTSGGRKGLV